MHTSSNFGYARFACCLLALLLAGCANPGPEVRAYVAATDQPLTEYVRLMGEYAHLSEQVKKRMDSVAMTPELAARIAGDLHEPLTILKRQYETAKSQLAQAPPAPKPALGYQQSVNDMFDMMGKLLTNYRDLATEMEKGRAASIDRMSKLSREMESYAAAASVSLQDAQAKRRDLEAKYPAPK